MGSKGPLLSMMVLNRNKDNLSIQADFSIPCVCGIHNSMAHTFERPAKITWFRMFYF